MDGDDVKTERLCELGYIAVVGIKSRLILSSADCNNLSVKFGRGTSRMAAGAPVSRFGRIACHDSEFDRSLLVERHNA